MLLTLQNMDFCSNEFVIRIERIHIIPPIKAKYETFKYIHVGVLNQGKSESGENMKI